MRAAKNTAKQNPETPCLEGAAFPKSNGITVETPEPGVEEVTIKFKRAVAAAGDADSAVVGATKHFVIVAEKLGDVASPAYPDLPPYHLLLRARPGQEWKIVDGAGTKVIGDEQGGRVLYAGPNGIEVYERDEVYTYEKTLLGKLKIELDTTNEYGERPAKRTTAKSGRYRKDWESHWDKESLQFLFDPGFEKGTLRRVSLADARKIPGLRAFIEEFEHVREVEIEREMQDGLVALAHSPKTNSYALVYYTFGELDAWLYVLDGQGKLIGRFDVKNSGAKSFEQC